MIKDLQKRLAEHKLEVELTNKAKAWLAKRECLGLEKQFVESYFAVREVEQEVEEAQVGLPEAPAASYLFARFKLPELKDLCREFDLVVDGSDNFPTRYLVNDACVLSRRPNVYGSVFRFEGQASVFALPQGPCYRCLFQDPQPPGLVPSCAEAGILGVVPGIIGSIQALEVIKLVVGCGDPLVGRLLLFDALVPSFRELRLRKDPDCPVCGDPGLVGERVRAPFVPVSRLKVTQEAGGHRAMTPEQMLERHGHLVDPVTGKF